MKNLVVVALIITAISLTGCGTKDKTATKSQVQQEQIQSTIETDVTPKDTTTEVPSPTLKNTTPVKVEPETVKKNVESVTKTNEKLTAIDNILNSIGDFNVTNNSGLK